MLLTYKSIHPSWLKSPQLTDIPAEMSSTPAVDAEHRGAGIGRKLIEFALDHFRSLGLKYARIETLDQNPAGQKLYPSFGFREIARQIHYGMPLGE